MERRTLAGYGVDVIDDPIMLIIELYIRSRARDTFLTFLVKSLPRNPPAVYSRRAALSGMSILGGSPLLTSLFSTAFPFLSFISISMRSKLRPRNAS